MDRIASGRACARIGAGGGLRDAGSPGQSGVMWAYGAGGVRNAGEKTRCGNIAVKVE